MDVQTVSLTHRVCMSMMYLEILTFCSLSYLTLVTCPAAGVTYLAAGAMCPVARITCPAAGVITCPAAGAMCPAAGVTCPAAGAMCPAAGVTCPAAGATQPVLEGSPTVMTMHMACPTIAHVIMKMSLHAQYKKWADAPYYRMTLLYRTLQIWLLLCLQYMSLTTVMSPPIATGIMVL